MEERIRIAFELALKLGKEFQGAHEVEAADEAIIKKYMDMGLIIYAKGKKGKMSQLFYFPTIQSKEFEGLHAGLWFMVMRLVIDYLGIDSGLSQNSVAEYMSRGWIKYNIKPTIIPNSYASKVDIDEGERVVALLRKELFNV